MDKPPFDPDKKPKKIAVAGKKGYGMSAAAHLAKMAMKKAAEKKMANEDINYVDEVRDPSMAGVKVGEKVRLTNPKAPPRHTLDKIKGNTAYITKGDGSKMTLPLDRIKRVKAQSMKEEVQHLEELTTRIDMPVYDKYITDVRRKKGGGSITYGEVAAHHGTKALPDIIKHLTKERDDLMTKHRTVKVGMLHDNAIKGFKSVLKHSKSQQNEEVEHLDESVKVAKAAAVEAHSKGMSPTAAENHILDAVISAHKGKSEGAEGGVTRARINSATDAGVAHFKKLRGMSEEREMLTLRDILEGRGRPRKNPDDPKWKKMEAKPKTGGDDEEEEDSGPARPGSPHLATEPDKHISVQLKVAEDMKDEKGGADVKFSNGKTHFVKHDVASKVLNALDKVKPAQRAELHDHIAQSHDNLMAVHKLVS